MRLRHALSRVRRSPVVVLGNQKCGTTVVAALLAEVAGVSATLDIFHRVTPSPLPGLLTGEKSLADFVDRHRFYFSTAVIKEPNLSFLYPQLRARFPGARMAWVQRDPRDNIRSILDRLGIHGTVEHLDDRRRAELPPGWDIVLDGTLFACAGRSPIETLAKRWCRAADVAFVNRDAITVFRYEDFVRDKVGSIATLAAVLGLPRRRDISDKVDVQYQPKGRPDVPWIEFFGADNLRLIETTCSHRMSWFGYRTDPQRHEGS